MINFYQEVAQSHVDDLTSKITKLSTKDIPEFLKCICTVFSKVINQEAEEILDDKELKSFRILLYYVTELIDIFSKTRPDVSSSWALPLIKECYRNAGISSTNRKILIIHAEDSPSYRVYADILPVGFKAKFDIGDIIDIFVIPSEAKFDVASICLVAHETGHVYLNSNKTVLLNFINDEFDEFLIKDKIGDKKVVDLFSVTELDQYRSILSSHIEEYICDFFGRLLLGVAFDFALLKLFSNSEFESSDVSETHPPVTNRINYSLENLKKQTSRIGELTTCLKNLALNFKEASRNDNRYIKLAEDIAAGFLSKYVHISPAFDEANLETAWNIVTPELNSFRPPFETVSINTLKLITPSQALVCGTLYFHGKHYEKGNEFFLQSSLDDTAKYSVLRKRFIEHIRYAISNYDFVVKAQSKIKFDDIKTDLDSTIWSLRQKKVAGKSISHVVIVPTIDPKIQYSSNSVDLRLGSIFLVNSLSKYTHIAPDKSESKTDIPLEAYYDNYFIDIGDEFTLHPHQFILAQTLEYVCIPPEYYALVLGRSTWGRLGLTIATATAVGSGFRGCVTLELRNLGETPLKLKVGVRICQICLIPIPIDNSPAGYFANASKYIGPVAPEIPKIREDKDWVLLND